MSNPFLFNFLQRYTRLFNINSDKDIILILVPKAIVLALFLKHLGFRKECKTILENSVILFINIITTYIFKVDTKKTFNIYILMYISIMMIPFLGKIKAVRVLLEIMIFIGNIMGYVFIIDEDIDEKIRILIKFI